MINAETSLKNGWDRDFQAKKGRMVELTEKMGGKSGSENPIVDPQLRVLLF